MPASNSIVLSRGPQNIADISRQASLEIISACQDATSSLVALSSGRATCSLTHVQNLQYSVSTDWTWLHMQMLHGGSSTQLEKNSPGIFDMLHLPTASFSRLRHIFQLESCIPESRNCLEARGVLQQGLHERVTIRKDCHLVHVGSTLQYQRGTHANGTGRLNNSKLED